MEEKLREYRALRRRKELIEKTKERIDNTKQKLADLFIPKIFRDMDKEKKEEEVILLEEEELPPQEPVPLIFDDVDAMSEDNEEKSTIGEKQETWQYFIIKWLIYTLVWLSLYAYFLMVGFGAVFFVISALIGICLNTRTRKKREGEVSAYSVFNKNCASIKGTLDAEKLQKEMVYGAGAMRLF